MSSFLLCRPDFFNISYSINPWMNNEKVDVSNALRQWQNLEFELKINGCNVETIDQVQGLPDMVFTANAGTVHKNNIVMSNFKHKERRDERAIFREWFDKKNYNIIDLHETMIFEGCGDTAIHNNIMIGGYGFRSDLISLEVAAGALNISLVDVKLVDPRFYHLDTCFCIVSKNEAIFYPGAFDKKSISKLETVFDLIPVTEEDAEQFICNSVIVGDTMIMPKNSSKITKKLAQKKIKMVQIDLSEFKKSGGSAQCLCLKI